jgi:hypothetical protein
LLDSLLMEKLALKLILIAPNSHLYAAFKDYFNYFPSVEIVNNYFEWLTEFDCLVSPGDFSPNLDRGEAQQEAKSQ